MIAMDACCWHGTTDADYCCLCVGQMCGEALLHRNKRLHDEREARPWADTHPGEVPF